MTNLHRYCLSCVDTKVDWKTNRNIEWRDDEGNTVAPAQTRSGRRAAATAARPHCPEGHPLAEEQAITLGFFGLPRAGKDSMIDAMREQLAADSLRRYGVSGSIDGRDLDAWTSSLGAATPRADELHPYRAVTFRLVTEGLGAPRQLLVFNTAGDQWLEADGKATRGVHTFLPELDIIVIAIPPEALPGVPADLRLSEGILPEARKYMIRGMGNLRDHIRASGVRRRRTVVLALTKCDRYASLDSFPERLLQPRARNGLASTLAQEQHLAARFMVENGGGQYLSIAREIATPTYLAAVSGTGIDDLHESSRRGAAATAAEPTRALDPLLYSLMRDGIGRYA